MAFALRLCSQIGRTLAELWGFAGPGDPLSSAEFCLWGAYYRSHGFDADRSEWAAANAGAAVAGAWGGRIDPAALVPKFGDDPLAKLARLRAWLGTVGREA